jgi:hypothetical protein
MMSILVGTSARRGLQQLGKRTDTKTAALLPTSLVTGQNQGYGEDPEKKEMHVS